MDCFKYFIDYDNEKIFNEKYIYDFNRIKNIIYED